MTKNEMGCKSGFKETFLIPAISKGILDELSFSVKDAINIEGHRTGFGNPLWEETHSVAVENAICIQQILANGATCRGKTIMGELGCGSAGSNHFFGTPYNPHAHELVPGGSSSGSAVNVANGSVDFSIGTDAGGSIRVPASFCGILGMRPSQGIISMAGVTSLAPSYDTVGVFANSIEVLSKVMSILVDNEYQDNGKVGDIYIIEDLVQLCSDEVKSAINEISHIWFDIFKKKSLKIKLNDIDVNADHPVLGVANTFLNVFCSETWNSVSSWANEVKLKFAENTYVDFSFMKNLDKKAVVKSFLRNEYYFKKINNFLSPNKLFLIPTTPFTSISRSSINTKINEFDYARLRPLVSLASVGRLPQINIPIISRNAAPLGVSLIAGFNKDFYMLTIAKQIMDVIVNRA